MNIVKRVEVNLLVKIWSQLIKTYSDISSLQFNNFLSF